MNRGHSYLALSPHEGRVGSSSKCYACTSIYNRCTKGRYLIKTNSILALTLNHFRIFKQIFFLFLSRPSCKVFTTVTATLKAFQRKLSYRWFNYLHETRNTTNRCDLRLIASTSIFKLLYLTA